jgi:cobalt/nickel transport system permease protein
MRHSFLDEHSVIESPMSRLDPRVKVIGFLGLIACIAVTGRQSFPAYLLYGILVASLVTLSRIPPGHVLKRCLVTAPFIIMVAAFLPFMQGGQGGDVLYRLGPEQAGISVSRSGLLMFFGLAVKSLLSIAAIVVLTAGTPFASLLKALRQLRVPAIVIMVMSFMYRYLFIIEDEFMKMKQARDSRIAGGSGRLRFKSLANMTGVLFIRAYERSEAVYMAMCSRGFRGNMAGNVERFRLQYRDLAFLAVLALSLTGIQWVNFNG